MATDGILAPMISQVSCSMSGFGLRHRLPFRDLLIYLGFLGFPGGQTHGKYNQISRQTVQLVPGWDGTLGKLKVKA